MSSITFRCSSCNLMLKTAADKAGKRVKCSKCGTILTVPAGEETAEQVRPASPAPPPVRPAAPPVVIADDADFEPGPPPRRRPRHEPDDYDDRPRRDRRPPEDLDRDYDDDRPRGGRQQYADGGYADDAGRPRRMGAARPTAVVTLVGVLNLLYAFIFVAVSVGLMIAGPTLVGIMTGTAEDILDRNPFPPGHPDFNKAVEQQKEVAKDMLRGARAIGALAFMMVGSCGFVLGTVPLLFAGIGVLKRRQWGRVLTLVLGPLYMIAASSLLYEMWPRPNRYGWMLVGAMFAYGLIVFVILFIPRCAEEFE